MGLTSIFRIGALKGDYMCQDNSKSKQSALIISNEEIANNVYKMIIKQEQVANEAKPGQFINVYCKSESRILPRPISLCEVNREEGLVTIVYLVVGNGTKEFSSLQAGDRVDILGSLGNGFDIKDCKESIIVGGGVGTPPLLELVKNLPGKKKVFLGFRTGSFLVKEFEKYAEVHIATDDGSVGEKGTVTDLMKKVGVQGDIIYSCGPKPMLVAVKNMAEELDIDAQISLEERMGCGIGACVGCICKIKADTEIGYTYKKVCKDGPVFDAKEVIF
ncbi:MAG: dihydroorotate dehydrogenase electron transfer subunit [Vallitalea sp.]|jgi:dihydroorotate dehydrogenase electron transfer subunit|nr:dihydroorotate dehydrogenase electron transfer subunit [Vallitalea sp.]